MEVLAACAELVKWSGDVSPWIIQQVKNYTIEVECYDKSAMPCMGHLITSIISLLFARHTPLAHYFGEITDYS